MSASQAERHRFEPGHPLQNLVDRGFFLFVEESETGTIKPADIGDKKVWELSPYLFLIWRGKPYSLGSGGGLQTRRFMGSIPDFASIPPTPKGSARGLLSHLVRVRILLGVPIGVIRSRGDVMLEWECVVGLGQIWVSEKVEYSVVGVRNIPDPRKQYDKDILMSFKRKDKNGKEVFDSKTVLASTLCAGDSGWRRLPDVGTPKRTTTLMGIPAPSI